MKRETLLRAVEVLAAEPDDDKHVSQLRSAGFSAAEAEVLAEVRPEAFAIPILEELGVASVSDIASAKTRRGRWVKVVLSENPIFAAALSLAREHRASGVMAPNTYRTVAERASLIGAANQALNAGDTLKGGTVAIAFIGAKAENLGYRPWYVCWWRRHTG